MLRSKRSASPFSRNLLASSIAGVALAFSQFNVDPFSVGREGGGIGRANASIPRFAPVTPSFNQLPSPVASDSVSKTNEVETPDDPTTLRGIWAIKMASALLEKGCRDFAKIPDYTTNMFRQERVNGALGESQTIDMKVRHEPFSVYMKWQTGDRGRQLIYVDGQNNGNLLVQPGGIKGRLTGVLKLEPEGDLAMAESRHPITCAGLLQLGHQVLSYQKADLERGTGFECYLYDNQEFDGRPCYLYLITYDSKEIHETYRKSMIFVDKEYSLPICVKNFTWSKDANPESIDDETLIEFYAYTDLQFQKQLSAADFDQYNSDYKLRVR